MEKNEFLRYNDFLFQLGRCETMEELRKTFLPQLQLLIPYTHGSYISIARGREDGELLIFQLEQSIPANVKEEILTQGHNLSPAQFLL